MIVVLAVLVLLLVYFFVRCHKDQVKRQKIEAIELLGYCMDIYRLPGESSDDYLDRVRVYAINR